VDCSIQVLAKKAKTSLWTLTLLVDADGRERWRRVSATLPDIPSADEIFRRIRESPNPSSREVWRGDVGRLNQYVEAGHIPSSQINTKFVTHSS